MVTSDIFPLTATSERFLPSHFTSNGYLVGATGKLFHNRNKFWPSEWFNDTDVQSWPFISKPFPYKVCKKRQYYCTCKELGSESGDTCSDYLTARRVVLWIEQWQASKRPWFILAGFVRPHSDYRFPKKYRSLRTRRGMTTSGLTSNLPKIARTRIGKRLCSRNRKNSGKCFDAYTKAVYAADRYVGDIVESLKSTNQYDNTMIVLTSDHGFHFGFDNFAHWGKNTLFEASLKVPLVIKPALSFSPRSAVVTEPVELLDLYPTMLEYAGLDIPDELEGSSLVPFLTSDAGNPTLGRKPYTISMINLCARSRSPIRYKSCITFKQGVRTIYGVAFSIGNGTHRFTEWRTLLKHACKTYAKSQKQCEAKPGCMWAMNTARSPFTETRKRFVCIPSTADVSNVNWGPSGLLAKESYIISDQSKNHGGKLAPPVEIMQAVQNN
mmetsp:Transcript_5566/g.9942  ORF Transcript_5566/g.9942 Transcript_5566/m.9942 type:complete len:439 (-) Transcript_5566:405-1721(-)